MSSSFVALSIAEILKRLVVDCAGTAGASNLRNVGWVQEAYKIAEERRAVAEEQVERVRGSDAANDVQAEYEAEA